MSWQAAPVGHLDSVLGYQVQRRRADVSGNGGWEDVEDTGSPTDTFILDQDVLPKLPFMYRVRAHFDDPAGTSPWAYLHAVAQASGPPAFAPTIQARNDLPAPVADSYVKPKNGPSSLTVPAPGVLGVSCSLNNQNSVRVQPCLGRRQELG